MKSTFSLLGRLALTAIVVAAAGVVAVSLLGLLHEGAMDPRRPGPRRHCPDRA